MHNLEIIHNSFLDFGEASAKSRSLVAHQGLILSHLLRVSWWMGGDERADGSEKCFATLLKLLFNMAGSLGHEDTLEREKSFFSVYM